MPGLPPTKDDAALTKDVRAMIRVQDVSSMAGSLGQLVLGAGVCLGTGLAFATVMTFFLFLWFNDTYIGWLGWFLAYCVVLVPVFIWQEKKSRVDFISDVLPSLEAPSSMGEDQLNRLRFQIAAIASLLVWGPRALIDGVRAMRGRRTMAQEAAFDRAATLVLDLAKHDGGVDIKKLLHAPEDMQVFGAAVDLLDRFGWTGKSTDGKSLWLGSTFRKKLRDSAPQKRARVRMRVDPHG